MIAEPITRIDWQAARDRLASITTDTAALAGLDRLRACGEFDDAFMAAVVAENISLDWLLLGEGGARRVATAADAPFVHRYWSNGYERSVDGTTSS